ncbi:MAG: SIR2 family protein [Chthonomonas sp.]|nr:SIR2 family protein [Chthonomonas sp.]
MSNRSRDLLILLGAGASADAGIPTSAAMITQIEELLRNDPDWMPFRRLYEHVRSAIHYSAGLRGRFGDQVVYNIETLVNTLLELERNEEHPIYPFIASWNSRFLDLAGKDFCEIQKFREKILERLKGWMCPEDPGRRGYYSGLRNLQQDLNYSLRVFSLNYDLCVESLRANEFRVETGFAGEGPNNPWDPQRFAEIETSGDPFPELYLYKLHGSINWKRDTSGRLYQVDQIQNVNARAMELIFGREFKLEAGDPYLFYTYEFRRLTSEARTILTVGYGFADHHINKLLTQAIREPNGPRLCIASNCRQEDVDSEQDRIATLLDLNCEEINPCVVLPYRASELFTKEDIGSFIKNLIPQDAQPFLEAEVSSEENIDNGDCAGVQA